MRLDELEWKPSASEGYEFVWPMKDTSIVRVIGSEVYTITSYRMDRRGAHVQKLWNGLDALTAQCVLFDLTKPCPVADPS